MPKKYRLENEKCTLKNAPPNNIQQLDMATATFANKNM